MKVEELLACKHPDRLEEYQKMIDKRERLTRKIANLASKIYEEQDSLSVFTGLYDEMTDHDKALYTKHMEALNKAVIDREKAETKRDDVEEKIRAMQR